MNKRRRSYLFARGFCSFALMCLPSAYAYGDVGASFDAIHFSGALDVVNDYGIEHAPADAGRVKVRSFELTAAAPVDELFEALINVAAHDEAGTTLVELQEGFIRTSKLISRTSIKVGRFYLGVGQLNQMHSYRWAFTSAPKSQTTFLAKEPVADSGLEIRHEVETAFPLTLTAGATNGWTFSHAPAPGKRPMVATHYLRPSTNLKFENSSELELAVNYLGRTDGDSVQTRLVGLDVVYRRSAGTRVMNLIQMEAYHRFQQSSALPIAEDLGGYIYSEWAIQEKSAIGLRADAFTSLSLTRANGEHRNNLDLAFVPVFSYRASEHSLFRASYTFARESRDSDTTRTEQRVELQLVVMLGETSQQPLRRDTTTDH